MGSESAVYLPATTNAEQEGSMTKMFMVALMVAGALPAPGLAHGGGLNACGCHFDRKTGECHCHQPTGCGCPCQPPGCVALGSVGLGRDQPDPVVREPASAPGPGLLAGACGVERWAVKTLSDPAARGLHRQTPKPATVEQLASIPAPRWRARAPRSVAERRVYSVNACLVGFKLENDSDFHVVLRGESGETMIVEFPDPAGCAPRSYAPGLMQQAREAFLGLVPEPPTSSFRQLQHAIPITVVGPLFLDKVHGQDGVAPNGAEIHPVLRVRRSTGKCGE